MTRTIKQGLCLLVSLCLIGCGSGKQEPKDRPGRTKVSGTVTLKGAPVEGATVTLQPIQGGKGAFGLTDRNGKFVLGTFEKDDGAVPADYKVTITKVAAAASAPQPAPGEPGYDPDAKAEPPKHLLPEKYADVNKSGLTAKITTSPNESLDFKLE